MVEEFKPGDKDFRFSCFFRRLFVFFFRYSIGGLAGRERGIGREKGVIYGARDSDGNKGSLSEAKGGWFGDCRTTDGCIVDIAKSQEEKNRSGSTHEGMKL